MPAESYRPAAHGLSPYAQVCRLSTQHERDAASAAVERLIDAGFSYAEASAAVRNRRAAGTGAPVASQTLGRTGIARPPAAPRGRRRDDHATVRP